MSSRKQLLEKGYPPEWIAGEIQLAAYRRAAWTCEHCGMKFRPGTTTAQEHTNADGKPTILTVHHIDGNPANCDPSNLLACCQVCHLHIQARWKPGQVLPAEWPQPPKWIADRNLPFVPNGQLSLWSDKK